MSRTGSSIQKINFKSDPAYVAFAESHGSIFNSLEWLSVYPANLEVMGLYKGDRLIAIWNQWRDKKGPVAFLRTPPLMPGNALVMDLRSSNVASILSEVKEIMKSIAAYYADLKWTVVSLNFPPEVVDLQPFVWKDFKVVPAYTYRLPLPLNPEAIMERMHHKLRNAIAKSQADGLICKRVFDLSLVRSMVMRSFERKNVKVNVEIMNLLLNVYASESNSVAFACFDNDKLIAASFCVIDKDKIYYLFGGYDHQSGHRGAGAMCLYQSILFANESGKSIFDFEGSMLPEVERYFRDFGADLTPYYSVNKSGFLFEVIMKWKQPGKF